MARSSAKEDKAGPVASNAHWTHKEKMILLNTLLQEKKLGRMGDNGHKDRTYQSAIGALQAAGYPTRTIKALKSYVGKLKKTWKAITTLRGLSGFGWDTDRCVVTASDEVWADYIKAHKDAEHLRDTPFPYYDLVNELYAENTANGEHAIWTGHIADPAETGELQQAATPVNVQDSSPSSPASSVATLPVVPPVTRDALATEAGGSVSTGTRKRERNTGYSLLSTLSTSVDRLTQHLTASSSAPSSTSKTSFLNLTSPQRRNLAYQKLKERELALDSVDKASILRAFRETKVADEYLTLDDADEETRQVWLRMEIEDEMARTRAKRREQVD